LELKHHGKRQRLRRIGLAHRRTKIEQKQTKTTISKTETYSFAVLVDDVFYQNNCLVCVGFVHFTETNVCVFNVFLRCHCEGLFVAAVVVGLSWRIFELTRQREGH